MDLRDLFGKPPVIFADPDPNPPNPFMPGVAPKNEFSFKLPASTTMDDQGLEWEISTDHEIQLAILENELKKVMQRRKAQEQAQYQAPHPGQNDFFGAPVHGLMANGLFITEDQLCEMTQLLVCEEVEGGEIPRKTYSRSASVSTKSSSSSTEEGEGGDYQECEDN